MTKYEIECDIIPLEITRNFLALPTLKYVNRIDSDVLVSHNPYHGLMGGSVAKRLSKIDTLVMHLKADYWTESASKDVDLKRRLGFKIKRLQNEFSMDDVDFVIAISDWARRVALQHGVKQNIYTIPNGVDIKRFHPRPENPEYRTQVLCVLNFNIPRKIELIDEFFAAYEESGLKYVVTFLGGGRYLEKIKGRAKARNLDGLIEFKGHVENVNEYYSSCDVLIHPSNLDSFSMVVLEAAASEKPVITRNIGGIPELVIDGETGYITNEMDVLVGYIEELMEDEEKRREMGEKGRRHVTQNFVWEKSAKRFIQAFEQEGIDITGKTI